MKKRKEKERRMIEALDKHDMEELDTVDWKCKRWCKNCRRNGKTIQLDAKRHKEYECEKYDNPYEPGGKEILPRRNAPCSTGTRIATHHKGKRVRPNYETWERLEELEGKEVTGKLAKLLGMSEEEHQHYNENSDVNKRKKDPRRVPGSAGKVMDAKRGEAETKEREPEMRENKRRRTDELQF